MHYIYFSSTRDCPAVAHDYLFEKLRVAELK